jgi:hypothetical protein
MSQKKQFSVKFKMFQHDEVIIFASIMAQSRFFLTSFILLLSGWVAVGLGLNDSASNWIHHFCNHTTDNFFIHFSWLAEWLLIILAITFEDFSKAFRIVIRPYPPSCASFNVLP